MKTLKHGISWAIWSLIALIACLMIFTHVSPCQTWLGQRVSHVLSEQLGTEVSIGRLDLGILNRVIIDDVLIKDQQQKDMLKVGRLSVKMDYLSLLKKRVVISSIQLFNAHATLYRKDSLSATNLQFVIDKLSSKDSTDSSPINLAINSLIVRRSSLKYDEWDAPKKSTTINPKHLDINNISAHILLRSLTPEDLSFTVKRLAFMEQSGLTLSRMSFHLERHRENIKLDNFFLQLPRSSLSIQELTGTADFDHIGETLNYSCPVIEASITPVDFLFLSQRLNKLKSPVSIQMGLTGTANSMDVNKLSIISGDGNLKLNATGNASQRDKQLTWYVNLSQLEIESELFETLKHSFDEIPEQVCRIGDVSFIGNATSLVDGNIEVNGNMKMGIGNLLLRGEMSKDHHFSGHIETDGLQLGQLLDNEQMGLLATKVNLKGKKDDFMAKGEVSHFDYKGYTYHNITLDGTYNKGDVTGKLQIDDPNIETTIEGEYHETKPTVIKMIGNLAKLNPKALQLSDQWGDASFSGSINADFTANTINDAKGTIEIKDFTMSDSAFIYGIDCLHIHSGFEDGIHFLKLKGDMGEAELNGHFDWSTLPQSFISYVASKLPTLPGLPTKAPKTTNDFDIHLYLTETNWLRHLLGVNLELNQPLTLHANVNDSKHQINVNGQMPLFTFNDSRYEGGNINITSPNDTMKCEISATRVSEDKRRFDVSVHAIAANNDLSTSLRWDNNQNDMGMRGEINTRSKFYLNNEGQPEAHVHILPSHAVMGDAKWDIEPSGVVYNSDKLMVDHFMAAHKSQHIIIDGVASRNVSDSLKIDLNDIEVAYILDLVDFTSVSFSGQATGKAYVTQVFEEPDAWADLRVEHFEFEGGRMGVLDAQAQWNKTEKQIDIHAIADDGPEAKTLIDGYVSPTKNYIDLSIRGRGTYIDFLNTYASSFLNGVTGHATGDLNLVGPLSAMDLLGTLVVDGQATVTSLGTTYRLQQDTVVFVHDDILLKNTPAKDRYQNTAILNGGIHHENLSDLTFDLNVKTDKLLAYDLPETTDDLFYGTVFAAGEVNLQGRPGEVIIDCNATPLSGSVFTYNAANPDAINDQSFITWRDASHRTASQESADGTATERHGDIPSDLRINFLVNTTPEATLRLLMDVRTGDYITLAGEGVIRATYYNKGAFQMFGTYTVTRGTYGITIQNIIKKNFTFQNGGTIIFGGAPFDANLNLQALYMVNGVSLSDLSIGNSFSNNTARVNCIMKIQGQAGAPKVDFDLDILNVNSEEKQMIRSAITSEQEMNQQVLYLLSIGRFYSQGANNANTQQQYGQSQLAMQSFLSGTLSTQINDVLSQVLKSNNWNFGANISTGNEGWHNAEYEGVALSR